MGITDLNNNEMAVRSSYPVTPGQLPTVVSAMFTGPSLVNIQFSEPVMATTDDFTDFKITSGDLTDASRNIRSVTGSDTNTIGVIVVGPFNIDTIGTIDIEKSVTDKFGNTLAERLDDYAVLPDARPMIKSAGNHMSQRITIITLKTSLLILLTCKLEELDDKMMAISPRPIHCWYQCNSSGTIPPH